MESRLGNEQEWALERIIKKFNDIFALSPGELKCTELTRHGGACSYQATTSTNPIYTEEEK